MFAPTAIQFDSIEAEITGHLVRVSFNLAPIVIISVIIALVSESNFELQMSDRANEPTNSNYGLLTFLLRFFFFIRLIYRSTGQIELEGNFSVSLSFYLVFLFPTFELVIICCHQRS